MSRQILADTSRRRFVGSAAALGLLDAFGALAPAYAQGVPGPGRELRVGGDRAAELVIARTPFGHGGRSGSAVTINGTVPGPLLRFREGETVTLRVINRLDEDTSIHWHGLLVPSDQDGVPGISFPGIRAGETFTYRYRVRQNGTYWYHSHSALQEQAGHYAPMIIDPAGHDPVAYDREHVVMLSDWTFMNPHQVIAKLKKQADYFNYQQRTVTGLLRDARKVGWADAWADRRMWLQMRMDPTDILDVTASTYTYLANGLPPDANWTGLFRPGERVRLRFVNGSAMTYFNVRIPGLRMTVVQADGQNVRPVTVDEFQIATAETYDVIVQPDDRAYTVFAESMDRSGYARGTLAPRPGMSAPLPALRGRPLRTMVDMGMDMSSMDMAGMGHGGGSMPPMAGMGDGKQPPMPGMQQGSGGSMQGMQHGQGMPMQPAMQHGSQSQAMQPGMSGEGRVMPGTDMPDMAGMNSPVNGKHGSDTHGVGNAMVAQVQRNRLGEPGTGLENVGHRVLTYNDLHALKPSRDPRPPTREIEMHLTGNMEAFIWGIDGKKYSESGPPPMVRVGERVRLTFVNDTMMEHPMHQHGVFWELVNGADPAHRPRKHTINVKPAERLSLDFTYDEPGNFAMHCHQLLHMEAGMFRFFNVSDPA